jgi:hypothetical protein
MSNSRYPGALATDVYGIAAAEARTAHLQFSAAQMAAASTTAVHAAYLNTQPQNSAVCVVEAASAETDILTVTAPVALGATANVLKINLTTAAGDTLAVTKTDATYTINIALANSTANNNAAGTIQTALRALSTVGPTGSTIDVSAFSCAAGGNWDTAAVATGEEGAVSFAGGITAAAEVVTTDITNPPYARNITATSGGTAGDIKVGQVIITGTNLADEVITETLPVFTLNTATTVAGSKAFKTVTSISFPPHDGQSDVLPSRATVSIGFGDICGLPYYLVEKSVAMTCLNNAIDSAATVTTDADEIEKNTIDLHSALNGTVVDVYLFI